ncbi:MAG: AAA domain-containing protein [Ilumatobacter sp.]|nr:AAA domain-containing protein [Ilumatobacter sp.]
MHHHPHVVLVGVPGCGKSRTGSILARRMGRPFLDANSASGVPSGHVLRQNRTAEIDEAERGWLERVLGTSGPLVVSAPWEAVAVLDEVDRACFWAVWLDAAPETLTDRLREDDAAVSRTDLDAYLAEYRASTTVAERIVDVRIATDGRTPELVATDIAAAWQSRTSVA